MMISDPSGANGIRDAAGGYGPPGGGYPPGGGGGGYGGPPPGGGGYGGPPPGGFGGPPQGGGFGGPPQGGGFGGPPQGGGFGPPGGGFPPPGGPMMPGAGGDVNTTLPIILSVVGFFLCCGLPKLAFIIGFVFALQANSIKATGDVEGARAKAKAAMTVIIIGFVVGLLEYLGYSVSRALNG